MSIPDLTAKFQVNLVILHGVIQLLCLAPFHQCCVVLAPSAHAHDLQSE